MKPVHNTATRAFTLIELLVVVGIIMILSSLGLAGMHAMTRKADLTRCASNLKQIGAGVMLYAADNNTQLPGPTYAAQGPTDELSVAIAPYLGDTNTTKKLFQCPAFQKNPVFEDGKKPFYGGKSVELTDGTKVYPFGYKRNPASSSDLPTRLANIKNPSQAVALVDLDVLVAANSSAVSQPSHEKYRNTLYLDGHVEASSVK